MFDMPSPTLAVSSSAKRSACRGFRFESQGNSHQFPRSNQPRFPGCASLTGNDPRRARRAPACCLLPIVRPIALARRRAYPPAHDDPRPHPSSQVDGHPGQRRRVVTTTGPAAESRRPSSHPLLRDRPEGRAERPMTTAALPTEADSRNRLIGVALAAGGAGLFSLKGVVIKLAFAEGMGVSELLTLRMAFSLPVYLAIGVYAFLRARQKPTLRLYVTAAVLGIMSYYISSWLNFEGLRYVSAQLERLILYIYPTLVALIMWGVYKQPITARHVLALVLAYAGVAILFGAEIGHQGPDALLGGGLIFAGALIYAVYVTASKPVITAMGSTLFTAFAMSAASVAFLGQ